MLACTTLCCAVVIAACYMVQAAPLNDSNPSSRNLDTGLLKGGDFKRGVGQPYPDSEPAWMKRFRSKPRIHGTKKRSSVANEDSEINLSPKTDKLRDFYKNEREIYRKHFLRAMADIVKENEDPGLIRFNAEDKRLFGSSRVFRRNSGGREEAAPGKFLDDKTEDYGVEDWSQESGSAGEGDEGDEERALSEFKEKLMNDALAGGRRNRQKRSLYRNSQNGRRQKSRLHQRNGSGSKRGVGRLELNSKGRRQHGRSRTGGSRKRAGHRAKRSMIDITSTDDTFTDLELQLLNNEIYDTKNQLHRLDILKALLGMEDYESDNSSSEKHDGKNKRLFGTSRLDLKRWSMEDEEEKGNGEKRNGALKALETGKLYSMDDDERELENWKLLDTSTIDES